ncbi:RNA methyltransferase [Francisella tularensis subsp. novicida]|uniref:TrmH family RNA methyltransferase n=1 Tax=Francisella TaxID=262 RepID=UPI000158B0A7|nr:MULTISPECIES: RNA methyltransferase [Francisella]AEB27717.1 rRNA methyltransferase [Francisella cf. novicida Fx1]AJI46167.1 RNA 2'-O ribose methyltransferase substrate binding family protein [Francisella tularensis subsp. novicida F6168]AJJ47995.1 RNA 2'-O ribose methyltransferase substrate binding family protein [Francisella tularensis subsp. novicida]APC98438.1 RNA 2'-O ribose methyltransferase substrate binding family protein [Francisella tularensis subsp. novicida]EDN36107.1 rRNA methyl
MKNLSQKLYKEIKKLHSSQGRKKSQYYVIEGLRCSQEALKRLPQQQIIAILVTEKADNPNYPLNKKYIITEKDFEALSQTQNPQGVLILAEKPKLEELSFSDDFILVLDRIQDPGNIGTILRTAIAVGLKEVILINGTVDPFNPKAIRAGMGAQFSLKFSYITNLAELKNIAKLQQRKIWLTTPHQGVSCYAKEFKLANSILVFGEEANGIEDFSVGQKTMIPTLSDIESLNVAQAATIYLFEGLRQRLR